MSARPADVSSQIGDVRIVVLRGAEVPVLGRFTIRALAPLAAIAMSPGRLPKQPPSLDPNEDGALVASGPGGLLAAVADGHLGFDVADAVLDCLKVRAGQVLGEPVGDAEEVLESLVRDAQQRAVVTAGAAPRERSRSGTALTLALVAGGRLVITTVGDTYAALVTPNGRTRVFSRGSPFLAGNRKPRIESVRLPPAGRLVLASDGLVDYTASGLVESLAASTLDATPRDAVYALMDAALLGGAGDHVTVVCADLGRA